jgi:hypothetical protein
MLRARIEPIRRRLIIALMMSKIGLGGSTAGRRWRSIVLRAALLPDRINKRARSCRGAPAHRDAVIVGGMWF